MIIRKSSLRKQTERRPGGSARQLASRPHGSESSLGRVVMWVLRGGHGRQADDPVGELDELPFPDLLSPSAGAGPSTEGLANHLELAFLGRASAGELDAELDSMEVGEGAWRPEHFAGDLFVSELVRGPLALRGGGQVLPSHREFLTRALTTPPSELATIRYRQGVLRELDERPELAHALARLLGLQVQLLAHLRASRDDARLEPVRFRLEVLRAFRGTVQAMADGFSDARSGLQRLHSVGAQIRSSTAFGRLQALLDHQSAMARLGLEVVIGADGRLRHLQITGLREASGNPFYRRPLRRWLDRLRIALHGYSMDADELTDRLVMAVYQEIAPALARVVQLLCHVELYTAVRCFAAEARSRGLEVCLPELGASAGLRLKQLFNPLLLSMTRQPVATDVAADQPSSITLVTGPNSGGKTRLLQAVGITQLLGQCGLYVPCAAARIPLAAGLFASIVEVDRADQAEGRLGTELVRLRSLFESAPPGSVVLLDELCSGTNPSEAVEIVDTVLRLLGRLAPVAFVTTHFLDFAQQLASGSSAHELRFLQAEVDGERGATFRFVPGVATTSLAASTARRLGITFDELERRLDGRTRGNRSDDH